MASLIEADAMMEEATAVFLERYKDLLLALQRRNTPAPTDRQFQLMTAKSRLTDAPLCHDQRYALQAQTQPPRVQPTLLTNPLHLPAVLRAISTIQNAHLQKLRLYQLMDRNSSLQQAGEDAREQMLKQTLALLKKVLLSTGSRSSPAVLPLLTELEHFYSRKRSLLSQANASPAPPWMSSSAFQPSAPPSR